MDTLIGKLKWKIVNLLFNVCKKLCIKMYIFSVLLHNFLNHVYDNFIERIIFF